MKIEFNDDQHVVQEAVQLSNALLTNQKFYDAIAEHSNFDLTSDNVNPRIIADLLKNSLLVFSVEIFYPSKLQSIFKYRKTLAFTDARYPNSLFLNFKKLNREVAEIAATILHEAIHALDHEQKTYTFGHGNNSPIGKQNTAPYWIGNLAYRMLSNKAEKSTIIFDQIEEE